MMPGTFSPAAESRVIAQEGIDDYLIHRMVHFFAA
jgi:hypothetical protein